MDTDYKQYEKALQDSFSGQEVSGRTMGRPEVSLKEVRKAHWTNLWQEKAIYDLRNYVNLGPFEGDSASIGFKYAELVVKKIEDKGFLVNVMSDYKTPPKEKKYGLTLENSFCILR